MSNQMWYFQDPITKGRRGPVKTEELKVGSYFLHINKFKFCKSSSDIVLYYKTNYILASNRLYDEHNLVA